MSNRCISVRFLAARAAIAAVFAIGLLGGCGSESPSAEDGGVSTDTSSSSTDATDVSDELASVVDDANRMAPALESQLRGTDYPTTLDDARRVLTDAGIEPSDDNVVNGYEYDADTVEFVLCIEGPSGAHASYDTRPMTLLTTGETGGCPTG